jgi:type I restriction enzyme S subunit
MQDSELGEIPVGWSVKPFSSIARLDTTSAKPSQEPEKIWEHYSIPAFDEGECPAWELGGEIKSNKYRVNPSAVLSSKLNPHFPRTWVPDLQHPGLAICSTEFMQFIPLKTENRAFVAAMIVSRPFQDGIMMRVTGSTGSRQRAQPKQVAVMDVVLPSEALIDAYSERARSMYEMQSKNIWQIKSLDNLRDVLLPRLISGELKVLKERAEENSLKEAAHV